MRRLFTSQNPLARLLVSLACAASLVLPPPAVGSASVTEAAHPAHPHFSVLALWSTKVEQDHVDFARAAIEHFAAEAARDNFTFEATTDWNTLNPNTFARYNVVLWLDEFPQTPAQRANFEQYMEHGGAWLGFHIAAYTDSGTHWPWFVSFLGGGVFDTNSWPPLPAVLTVDTPSHPVTRGIPHQFLSPANEWYTWKPDPRSNKDVEVLMTLDPSNYPIGFKDTLIGGDVPVMWTNKRYKMLYMNMGHGDKIWTTPTQNQLIENSLLWVGSLATAGTGTNTATR